MGVRLQHCRKLHVHVSALHRLTIVISARLVIHGITKNGSDV
jgi:hypothetical protein